ncbi:MAG: hypothetical protein HRU00_14085 [Myxococcales bacterium]|nr:hypothetical protein [Myxococcales bacterium]
MRDVDARARVAGPSAAFDCPNYLAAKRLSEALELWGANVVIIEGRRVTVECETPLLYAIMGLCSAGIIDELQAGNLTAVHIADEYLAKMLGEPGESRG